MKESDILLGAFWSTVFIIALMWATERFFKKLDDCTQVRGDYVVNVCADGWEEHLAETIKNRQAEKNSEAAGGNRL